MTKKAATTQWKGALVLPMLIAGALTTGSFYVQAAEEQHAPQPPDVRLGPLYHAVQSAKFFPDQKTFADAVPKFNPASILADWQMQKNQRNFDLRRFVDSNFTLPAKGEAYVPPANQGLCESAPATGHRYARAGSD